MKEHDVQLLISDIEANIPMNLDKLEQFIDSVASRNIENSLVEQWLKAVHKNGISVDETTQLTKGMMQSGAVIEWDDNTLVVDKHSTGGVGDKMSLMLAPALAACGLRVPMLAGRGLGHTGGTIDKLESIPGFNCSLTPQEMQQQVEQIGCCIAAQNDAIAPADGLLYAIRDITNTIDSIPLITASIISKKAAEGLGSLVLDVKCGSAAFMQTIEDATALAESMVGAAQGLGINTIAQITEMEYPIGRYVGNTLEIIGSIEVLQGKGSSDTRDIVILQGASLLVQSGLVNSLELAEARMLEVIENGTALTKFKEMCVAQGVTEDVAAKLVQDPLEILQDSKLKTNINAHESGFISNIDSMVLAEIAREHGAGRLRFEDKIIPEIGFEIAVSRGQTIKEGEPWLIIHHNNQLSSTESELLSNCVTISSQPVELKPRLITTIS